MQYRIFDGDMERWDEEEINLSPEELRRRFGLPPLPNTADSNPNEQTQNSKTDNIHIPVDKENAHKITAPAYDVFDQELADKQFAEFLSAGNPPKNQDE